VAPTEPDQTTDLRSLTEVTAAAAEILTAAPRRRAAVTYLRQRGIDAAALPAEWSLGYAPPGWTRVVDQLRGRFGDEVLLEAGLALRSSRGTLIDTFRDRVIFPMHDRKGRVAGFIGRDVSGNPDTPKYLNTRQTPLFDKGELLYGPHEAHTTNPTARNRVIVEGPLDVFRDTHALPLLAVQVQSAIASQGDRMQWVEGRLGAARTIVRYLASYPSSYADAQTGWIADVLDLNVSTVTLELAGQRGQIAGGFSKPDPSAVDPGLATMRTTL
jgi:DNA primase catalytic core